MCVCAYVICPPLNLKGQSWNVTALEEDIISSVELISPDVACKSYVSVNQLLSLAESDEASDYSDFTQVNLLINYFKSALYFHFRF